MHVFAVHRTSDAHVPDAAGPRFRPPEDGRMLGEGISSVEQDRNHVRRCWQTATSFGTAGIVYILIRIVNLTNV